MTQRMLQRKGATTLNMSLSWVRKPPLSTSGNGGRLVSACIPALPRVLRAPNLGDGHEPPKGIVSAGERKNGWLLAEHAGVGRPTGMQRVLTQAVWDVDLVRDDLRPSWSTWRSPGGFGD